MKVNFKNFDADINKQFWCWTKTARIYSFSSMESLIPSLHQDKMTSLGFILNYSSVQEPQRVCLSEIFLGPTQSPSCWYALDISQVLFHVAYQPLLRLLVLFNVMLLLLDHVLLSLSNYWFGSIFNLSPTCVEKVKLAQMGRPKTSAEAGVVIKLQAVPHSSGEEPRGPLLLFPSPFPGDWTRLRNIVWKPLLIKIFYVNKLIPKLCHWNIYSFFLMDVWLRITPPVIS